MIGGLKAYPTMKDSGIPWLGQVPEHWETERAKWLFRKMSRPVRESDEVVTCFRDGTVTLRKNRRVRGFTESLKEIGYQGIRRNDLVIHAMDAFAGAIGVADADGKGTPVYAVCEPGPTADAHYYAYAVREMARSQWIQALAKGIRERSTDFRFEGFGSQPVPLPPLPEQAAIVRFLDYADRRIRQYIRAKQKLIKLLEEQKQAIIHRAVTRGLDPNVRLKPSGVEWLGDVPEHWDVVPLKRIGNVRIGLTYSPGDVSDESGTLVLRASNVRNSRIVHADDVRVSKKVPTTLRVREGDILVCVRSGSRSLVGKSALITKEFEGASYGAFMSLLRSTDNRFFFRVLNSNLLPTVMAQFETSTINQLTQHALRSLLVPVPPGAERVAITDFLDCGTTEADQAIAAAAAEIKLLREYRIRLIADVVTGKLDVRHAATRLPDDVEEPEPLDESVEDGEAGEEGQVRTADIDEVAEEAEA